MGWEGEDILWTQQFLRGFCMVLTSENYSRPTQSPVLVRSLPAQRSAFTGTICLVVGWLLWAEPLAPQSHSPGLGPRLSPRSCEAVVGVLPTGGQRASWGRTGTEAPVPVS